MLDITPLITMLVKFDDSRECLVHYDPNSMRVFSNEKLTDEEIFLIREKYKDSYSTLYEVESQEVINSQFFDDMVDYYTNQDAAQLIQEQKNDN